MNFQLHFRDDLVIRRMEIDDSISNEIEPMKVESERLQPIKAKDYFDQRFCVTFRENEYEH